MNKPFGLMLEDLYDLQLNEVYLCTGSLHIMRFGENI